MKLIISEKPSTAKIIAHAVGAREKIYGEGKEFCYKGNGFYVVNARGHLYGVGMPQDYGYSKSYKMDELPMFPNSSFTPQERIPKICVTSLHTLSTSPKLMSLYVQQTQDVKVSLSFVTFITQITARSL